MSEKYDIDTYLNPYTPRPQFLEDLPWFISHFFGYRPPALTKTKPPHILLVWASHFIGAFCGVAIIEAVYLHLPPLGGHTVPVVIASFGASAILSYNAIEAPLAQPRNLVFGHLLSVIVGVVITKLFELLPEERYAQLQWLAGALAVGTASVVMSITKTVHPPAGATALLAATFDDTRALGWWMIAIVLLAAMLMLASALLIDNIGRRYPIYWWTPVDLAALREDIKKNDTTDVEKMGAHATAPATAPAPATQPQKPDESRNSSVGSLVTVSKTSSQTKPTKQCQEQDHKDQVLISSGGVTVPEGIELDESERMVLANIQKRLARPAGDDHHS